MTFTISLYIVDKWSFVFEIQELLSNQPIVKSAEIL